MIQKMNAGIASRLEEVADILEAQQANPYRVQAYRRAAMTVRNCDRPLAEIEGFEEKRIADVRGSLAGRLGRIRNPASAPTPEEPAVSEILDVDREYRMRTGKDELPKIAPRRFNPKHEAWLPILHTTRGDRHYTALFSNTSQAHQANKTHEWAVIYYALSTISKNRRHEFKNREKLS
jgi:DNA polymerase (family X)